MYKTENRRVTMKLKKLLITAVIPLTLGTLAASPSLAVDKPGRTTMHSTNTVPASPRSPDARNQESKTKSKRNPGIIMMNDFHQTSRPIKPGK
jgi:hypothetical protein